MTVDAASSRLYGKGVFTTIRVLNGRPLLWTSHWRRLTENAASLGIEIGDQRSILVRLDESAERVRDGRVRITIYDDTPAALWSSPDAPRGTSINIVSGPLSHIDRVRLTRSPYLVNTTSPLRGIKSCNYLDPLMALDEARGRGYDEAVRLNERGHVTSACMANLFWIKNARLFTPALSTGCLPGTTRGFVIQNAGCEEVEADLDALAEAEALFVTSAGLGVVPASGFGGPADAASRRLINDLMDALSGQ